MEIYDIESVADTLSAFNNEIIEQNDRYDMSRQITDEEFKVLAVRGLTAEQQQSVDRRQEAMQDVDYQEVFTYWDGVLQTKAQVQQEIAAVQSTIAEVSNQAELSVTIAPTLSAEIQKLAEEKIAAHHEEIAELNRALAAAQEREVGLIALSQPWIIPQLPDVHIAADTTTEVAEPAKPEAATQPKVEAAPEPKENTVSSLDREKADNPELRRVLWAVFGFASKAGEAGVRLEEMRKAVPELAELSKQDYQYFKDHFTDMRSDIVTMLDGMGYKVRWTTSGKTRGTRYHVHEITPVNKYEFPREPLPRGDRTPAAPVQKPKTETTPAAAAEIPKGDDVKQDDSQPKPAAQTAPAEVKPAASEQETDVKTICIVKNVTGASLTTGISTIVEVPITDLAKHLGIKKDPQFMREITKWADWLLENPRSTASRRLRSFRSIRFDSGTDLAPLFRFSPKDIPGLYVPKQYLRQRVVYALINNERPALLDVLDHESFDRRYR